MTEADASAAEACRTPPLSPSATPRTPNAQPHTGSVGSAGSHDDAGADLPPDGRKNYTLWAEVVSVRAANDTLEQELEAAHAANERLSLILSGMNDRLRAQLEALLARGLHTEDHVHMASQLRELLAYEEQFKQVRAPRGDGGVRMPCVGSHVFRAQAQCARRACQPHGLNATHARARITLCSRASSHAHRTWSTIFGTGASWHPGVCSAPNPKR